MRLCRHVFVRHHCSSCDAVGCRAGPAGDGLSRMTAKPQEPDTDIFALMSGKCSTLKIAGRDFACKTVGFFHNEEGRTNFTDRRRRSGRQQSRDLVLG